MGEERIWDVPTRSWKTRTTTSDTELADAQAKDKFQDTSTLVDAAKTNKAAAKAAPPVEDSPLVAASKKAQKAKKDAQLNALK